MKRKLLTKKWLIALVAVGVMIVGLGIAVPALAQTRQPSTSVSSGVYMDTPTLTRLATALGISQQSLVDQLKTGKTLAQIATEQNKPQSSLVDAIVAPLADRLAIQVKYGYLTQDESQTILQTARDQATNLLQQDLSKPGNGLYGCGNGAGGYGGMMGGYGGMMGGAYGQYGPGMMRGWSGSDNGGTTTPTTPTAPQTATSTGRGMMGGYSGMMRTW